MVEHKLQENLRGFLLYSPFSADGTVAEPGKGEFIFRVYDKTNKKIFKDYEIRHCDLEVEIIGKYASLYESEEVNYIDYPSRHQPEES